MRQSQQQQTWRNVVTPIQAQEVQYARETRIEHLDKKLIPHLEKLYYENAPSVPLDYQSASERKKFLDAFRYIHAEQRKTEIEQNRSFSDALRTPQRTNTRHALQQELKRCKVILEVEQPPSNDMRKAVENWQKKVKSTDDYSRWLPKHEFIGESLKRRQRELETLRGKAVETGPHSRPLELFQLQKLLNSSPNDPTFKTLPSPGSEEEIKKLDPKLQQQINAVNTHLGWLGDIKQGLEADPSSKALKKEYAERMEMLKKSFNELVNATNNHHSLAQLKKLPDYNLFRKSLIGFDKEINHPFRSSNVKIPEAKRGDNNKTSHAYVWEGGKKRKAITDPETNQPMEFSDETWEKALKEVRDSGITYKTVRGDTFSWCFRKGAPPGFTNYRFNSPEEKAKLIQALVRHQRDENNKKMQPDKVDEVGVRATPTPSASSASP